MLCYWYNRIFDDKLLIITSLHYCKFMIPLKAFQYTLVFPDYKIDFNLYYENKQCI